MSRIALFDPELLTPHINFTNIQAEENFNLFRRLDEKRAAATPWLINFAKILSEHVLRIKTKSQGIIG